MCYVVVDVGEAVCLVCRFDVYDMGQRDWLRVHSVALIVLCLQ